MSHLLGYLKSLEFKSLVELLRELKLDRRVVLKATAFSVLGLGVIYLGKIWRSYGFFKKRGIKTPPYTFLFGNVPEILEKDYSNILVEWTQKYGKTYGYFEGHLPILVTSDLELIEEIFYKKFSHFAARKRHPQQVDDDGPDSNVFLASKNRWKRLRNISNQTFSPAKLKGLLPAMKMCSNRLVDIISQNIDNEINISDLIDRMALDVVWNCMFGIDADLQHNYNFNYFVRIQEFLTNLADFGLSFMLTTYFYELKPLIVSFCSIYTFFLARLGSKLGNPFFWMMDQVHEIIEQRMNEINKLDMNKNGKKHDLVQLLIDAEANDVNLEFDNHQYESANTTRIEKKMTRREILRSLVGFMIAGFGTTASTLSFAIHILINHPEELEKLRDEIDSLSDFNYESINQLEYLDMFVKEVLRVYPVVNSLQNRRCTQAINLKGIDFPVDLLVAVDVLSLHYDPENWPGVDPKIFYPLRFAPDAKYNKLAYMPFGAGARICVGMRFAMLEIKLTLANILRNFDILPGKSNEKTDLSIRDGLFTIRKPRNGISAIFKKRDI